MRALYRQAMLRQAVVIMSNEVVLGEGDVEAENGIYKDMDKGSRDREGNGKRSSVQTCVYILKYVLLLLLLCFALPVSLVFLQLLKSLIRTCFFFMPSLLH